jgi:hypothetical protein
MGLEVVTHISDLVITNPVGATDPKSQGDDHIRNIKKALKTDLPAITGPVLASQAELNILDGALVTTAELNLLSGLTLTAAQINDAARKSQNNTFTGASQSVSNAANGSGWSVLNGSGLQAVLAYSTTGPTGYVGTLSAHAFDVLTNGVSRITISSAGVIALNGVAATDFARLSQANAFAARQDFTGTSTGNDFSIDIRSAAPGILLSATGQAADAKNWRMWVSGLDWALQTETDAGAGGASAITVTRSGTTVTALALSATAITLNGVAATDFARLSHANTFTNAAQGISATNGAWSVTDSGTTAAYTATWGGTISNVGWSVRTNNTARYDISSGGNHDFKSGTAVFGGAATFNSTLQANSTLTAAGAFATSNTITPTALSASQNDYAPTGHATASIFRLDPNGNTPATITGIAGGAPGRRIIIYKIAGTTGTIDLARESASSTAANRIANGASAYTLTSSLLAFELIYDTTASRWIVLGGIS